MFVVFKQKTAYEMRISDGSSDVCSSDLVSSTTSIAVVGGGFIPVSKKNGENASTGLPTFETTGYYTRVGDFNQNVDGYLVNSSGYFLRGWSVDPTTNVVDTSSNQEVRVSNMLDAPVARSEVRSEGKECVSTWRLRGWPDN